MKRAVAVSLLLATTFVWGVTFTLVKVAIAEVGVAVFLAQRFLAAALILAALAAAGRGRLDAATLRRGAALGAALFAAYVLQTLALRSTSASNAGFLTGLAVVLVPLLEALVFRRPVPGRLRLAVAMAAAGLFLLVTNGRWSLNAGDGLAAVCALFVAVHVVLTGRFAGESDVAWLAAVQIGVVALGSLAAAAAGGADIWVWHPRIAGALAVCVLLATVFAFLVQTAAQRTLSPTATALVFCMEPVFAAVWARFALGERLGAAGTAGAALILAAMLVAEAGCARERPAAGFRVR